MFSGNNWWLVWREREGGRRERRRGRGGEGRGIMPLRGGERERQREETCFLNRENGGRGRKRGSRSIGLRKMERNRKTR